MKISEFYIYAPKSKIKAGDANPRGYYQFFTSSPDEDRRCDEAIYNSPAIIMGTGGGATIHYFDGEFSTSTDCLVLIPKDNIDPKYLYYVFLGNIEYLKSGFHGAGLQHTSKNHIDNLEIDKIPSLESQKKIVKLFSRLEKLITDKRNQLINLDSLIKARFVEMFEDGKYPQTTIAELVSGKVPSVKKDFLPDETIKYIDISSIDNKQNVMTGYTEYAVKEAPSRAQQHISKGDIVISTVRPNLRNVAITQYEDNNLVASSGFCVLRTSKCLPEYLMAIVTSDKFTDDMTKVVTGANYPAIKDSDVMSYQVALPPMELQELFADFVKQVDKSKFAISTTQYIYDEILLHLFDSLWHSA